MNSRKLNNLILFTLLLFIILFSSCKRETVKENILYEAILSEPRSLDPGDPVDSETYGIMYCIYNTMVEMDDSLKIQPALAYKWETNDFKTWKFYIRNDIYFHPSPCFKNPEKTRKLTAYDIEYSLNRALQPGGVGAFMLTDIVLGALDVNSGKTQKASGITALDSFTIQIKLVKPYLKLPERLATPFFFIVPKEAVEFYGDKFAQNPVGTGAFMLEKIDPGNAVFLKKNPLFWKKSPDGKQLPHLDGVVFKILRNPQLALNEFLNGKLDAVELQPALASIVLNHRGELKDEYRKKFKLVENVALDAHYFSFRMDQPPFKNNKYLRQALNYAINKEIICEKLLNNLATPSIGILPPGVLSDIKRNPVYPYDKQKAIALLEKAGYPGGKNLPELELYIDNKPTTETVAQFVQSSLKEIGVSVKLRKMEFGSLLGEVIQGNPKFYYMFWEGTDPNPEIFMVQFKSNLLPELGGYNFSRFSNKEADRLFDLAVSQLDEHRSAQTWLELDSLITEEAPCIFLYHTIRIRLLQKNISNYDNNPMQIRRYYTTSKKVK